MSVYFLAIIILLLMGGLWAVILGLRRKLQQTQEAVKELRAKLNEMEPAGVHKRLAELDKSLGAIAEKEDRELNTLWAEFENLRKELLVQLDGSITAAQWRALLESHIPSFAAIKEHLDLLMAANEELAMQLRRTLPAYLTSNDLLSGLLDLVRTPFDRVNWVDALILPVSAKLDGAEGTTLEAPFGRLLDALGYSSILPTTGEIYRPDRHEVVEQRLSASQRGTILATRARGYCKNDTVVRKAKVVISAGQN